MTQESCAKPFWNRALITLAGWLFMALCIAGAGHMLTPAALADTGFEDTVKDLRAEIGALREATEQDETLGADDSEARLTRLTAAQANIALAEKEQQARNELSTTVKNADATAADLRARIKDIERAPATLIGRLGKTPELADIEAELALVEAQRDQWTRERREALDALAALAENDRQRRERVTELVAALDEATADDLKTPGSDTDSEVKRISVAAERLAQQAEEQHLRLELQAGPAVNSIRTARIAWLDAAIAESDSLLETLRAAAAANRETTAARRSAEIRRTLALLDSVPAEIQARGERNIELSRALQTTAKRIDSERREISVTRSTAERIDQDANLTRRRLDVAGLESRLGEVMLSRLASLPDPRTVRAQISSRSDRIADVSISAIDTEQDIRQLSTLNPAPGDPTIGSARSELELQVTAQLDDQYRELLQAKLQAENGLLSLLVDHNQSTEALATAAADYKELLTAQLLWVRSYAFAQPQQIRANLNFMQASAPVSMLLEHWPRLAGDPLLLILCLILLILIWKRRSIRHSLHEALGKPIRPSDESKALILSCLMLTLLRAIPFPLILVVSGRVCMLVANGDKVLNALYPALTYTGLALLFWRYFATLGARFGTGRRLLKWNSQKLDAATRDFAWGRPLLAIALFTTLFGRALSPTYSGGALAATGSILIALIMLFISIRAIRSEQFASDPLGLLCLRIGALLCAAIIVMHLSGQLFAAHLYLLATAGSIAAVLGVLFVANVLQRILLIYRSRLAREQREEQRARNMAKDEQDAELSDAEDTLNAVSSLSEAYSRLLGLLRFLALAALLWLIWSPALPALNVFDSITLWSTVDASLPGDGIRNVTLSTAMLAIVVAGTALLLTRHLPPLINVMLMEWTSVTPGARYAIGMLMQYLIIGVGFSSAMVMLGFQWEKVQWLVAALGVGIGFGLQEIVANFISGLIVLFERPIRVGDIINAGGADGTVTRINARATVIETFEGKEVMVPNKELITNVVTNWSLSSSRLRIVIPIGVAYGSDVGEAMRLLHKVALEHPEILSEPYPTVTFEDFGDNALLLWLRCYALREYPRVSTELRHRIYDVFNDADINIAFPQRDIHLDASTPIPIELVGKPAT
ncbi:MAG: mechanosensitive ion channel domain-containing protein [Congregibacter sp.]